MVGARALAKRVVSDTGLTTNLPPLDRLGLVGPGDIVFVVDPDRGRDGSVDEVLDRARTNDVEHLREVGGRRADMARPEVAGRF